MVLTAASRSPRCAGFWPPYRDNALTRIALDTSFGVSGPRDLTVQAGSFVGANHFTLRPDMPTAFRCRRP
ncbi:hypothetical protein BRADO5999 [Bradyrhizobium sp. ORS 278]|nr:hypothetical protein BRADO5999 [Bradyrhizobium sp. ORS 278]